MHRYVLSRFANSVSGILYFFPQISYTKWPSNEATHFIQILHLMFTNVSFLNLKIVLLIFYFFMFLKL